MRPAYFLTFHAYGTWLHGDERGSVDPKHNIPGTPVLNPDQRLLERDRSNLQHAPCKFNTEARRVVEATIGEVCRHRGWELHAINVRTNHVHVVLSAAKEPGRVLADLKAWCTRRLIEAGCLPAATCVWSRHGSTRWLNDERSFVAACAYVVERQGADLD